MTRAFPARIRAINRAKASVSRGPILKESDDFIQARFLSSFPRATVLFESNLPPRPGRAGLEASHGDQLSLQCGRSHGSSPFASQHRMHRLEVSPTHVFIDVTGDV